MAQAQKVDHELRIIQIREQIAEATKFGLVDEKHSGIYQQTLLEILNECERGRQAQQAAIDNLTRQIAIAEGQMHAFSMMGSIVHNTLVGFVRLAHKTATEELERRREREEREAYRQKLEEEKRAADEAKKIADETAKTQETETRAELKEEPTQENSLSSPTLPSIAQSIPPPLPVDATSTTYLSAPPSPPPPLPGRPLGGPMRRAKT